MNCIQYMRDNVILLYIYVMVRVGLGVVPALYCKKNILYIVVILLCSIHQ
jgi:hypothetical protein